MSDDQRPSDPESTRLDSGDVGDHAQDPARNDSSTGKRLGDFDLLREIGRGGTGR